VTAVHLAWRNGIFTIGRDFWRGPDAMHILLAWNNREDIEGRMPPQGEYIFMDHIEIGWLRPVRRLWFHRYKQ